MAASLNGWIEFVTCEASKDCEFVCLNVLFSFIDPRCKRLSLLNFNFFSVMFQGITRLLLTRIPHFREVSIPGPVRGLGRLSNLMELREEHVDFFYFFERWF